jgi:hypothetical protein
MEIYAVGLMPAEPPDPNVRHRKMMDGGFEGKLEGAFQEPREGEMWEPYDPNGNTVKCRDMKKG